MSVAALELEVQRDGVPGGFTVLRAQVDAAPGDVDPVLREELLGRGEGKLHRQPDRPLAFALPSRGPRIASRVSLRQVMPILRPSG